LGGIVVDVELLVVEVVVEALEVVVRELEVVGSSAKARVWSGSSAVLDETRANMSAPERAPPPIASKTLEEVADTGHEGNEGPPGQHRV
jgi:hypothetical protein